MNLKLTSFENLTQGRVSFIPWKWQVVYVIPRLVVNTFFQRRIHTSNTSVYFNNREIIYIILIVSSYL